jgi:sugar lactone lactonase YvrE
MLDRHVPFGSPKSIAFATMCALMVGCGGRTGLWTRGGGSGGSDALGGPGGSRDAGADGKADVADARPDADTAFGRDVGKEAGQEVTREVGQEVGREAGQEVGREVGNEVGRDALPDTVPEVDSPPRIPVLKLVAGGVGGPGDADGIGRAARFYTPTGLYFDGAGNLFVTDKFNNTIRKIVLATAAVTTVAGTPLRIGSDDGIGAAARFNRPSGITGDGAGNLFVADTSNNTIRKIDLATGTVSTLAGSPGVTGSSDGTGTAAEFNRPVGLAMDKEGDLYVADSYNNVIRKVVVATGVVTTFAGKVREYGRQDGVGADARFGSLAGMASDGAGNLLVADRGNYAIRMIDIATGAVSTVPQWDKNPLLRLPESVTTDGAGNLFITDTNIQKLVLATESVTTFAGSSKPGAVDGTGEEAMFDDPSGIVYDSAGNLFVADTNNNTIRKIVIATGTVTTFAGMARPEGSGSTGDFVEPRSLAIDGAGDLFVADRIDCAIRKVVVASGAVTTFAGLSRHCVYGDGVGEQAGFLPLYGMVNDGAGNLFVADYASVRKLVLATATVTTVAGSKDHGYADGVGSSAQFNNLGGVAYDGGSLYIADTNNHVIRKVWTLGGEASTLAGMPQAVGTADGTGSAARFNYPEGIVYDGAGSLLVGDTDNHTIRKIVIATGEVETIAGEPGKSGSNDGVGSAARFNRPKGVAVDRKNQLFVADSDNHTVRKIDLATGTVSTLVGVPGQLGFMSGPLPASLGCPSGLLVGPTGNLFITDDCEHNVLVVEF